MRRTLLAVLALAVLLLPASVQAQSKAKLTISQVRVGFSAASQLGDLDGEAVPLFKAGAWTPVMVDITVGAPGLKGNEGRIEVIVETPDADDVATNYTVSEALPEMGPNGTFTVAAFTKVGSATSDITVTLRGADGQTIGQPYKRSHSGMDANQLLYLTVGSRMPGLRQSLRGNENQQPSQREQVAFADKITDLPEQWFGYEGVDLLVLSTSKRNDFLMEFANPRQKKRVEALVEWVERGGHIVISAGKNQDVLANMPELQAILPVRIAKSAPLTDLRVGAGGQHGAIAGGGRPAIELAQFEPKPGRSFVVLVRSAEEIGGPEPRPLAVQAPYGMGRVTVVAFDLDQKPFSDWKGQNEFWQDFLKLAADRNNVTVDNQIPEMTNRFTYMEDGNGAELLGQIQSHLENFEEVPVISFGWVALFILIYIIVVGPLDYFFLKKVVKRLELTWITFPTVVLVVSAIAYFTAYQLKGNDLRIRKLDVVDVDLHTQQTFGHTWFTLFSPRIQHYTIGIEPATPEWAPAATDTSRASVLVSWLNRPQNDMFGGRSRSRGQSLFRRAYDYEGTATGLKGVPIQVWSTKSFTASWQAPLAGAKPLFAANLCHPVGNPDLVSGDVTWRPGENGPDGGELQDTYLIYKGRAHPFALVPGTPKRVDTLPLDLGGEGLSNWLKTGAPVVNQQQYYGRGGRWAGNAGPVNIDQVVKTAMFHQLIDRSTGYQRNSSLRLLDESWRARDNKDEMILVGRLVPQQGQADEVTAKAASASRLWLGELPGSGAARPALAGTLHQETYVRVFIPVQPAAKAKE